MSTYQRYEFLALDGPISDEGLRTAQGCSRRAEVSPYRWVNSYNWGDFSGSEDQLLQYYDAFLYFADWGSFRFSLAFPEGSLPPEAVDPYLSEGDHEFGAVLSCSDLSGRLVVCWEYHEDAVYWDDPLDLDGLLGRMAGIRELVMLGDYRAFFLVWLAAFDPDWVDDGEVCIPPIPPGMDQLNAALHCLAEQMRVEEDAVQAAIELSEGCRLPDPMPIADVIDSLSVFEMKRLLTCVVQEGGGCVRAELIQKTRSPVTVDDTPRITQAEFAARIRSIREERRRARAKKEEESRRKKAQIRKVHLEEVYAQSQAIWKRLDQCLVKKTPSAYDSALEQLKELRDAYAQAEDAGEFATQLSLFRERYARRPALMRRIDAL